MSCVARLLSASLEDRRSRNLAPGTCVFAEQRSRRTSQSRPRSEIGTLALQALRKLPSICLANPRQVHPYSRLPHAHSTTITRNPMSRLCTSNLWPTIQKQQKNFGIRRPQTPGNARSLGAGAEAIKHTALLVFQRLVRSELTALKEPPFVQKMRPGSCLFAGMEGNSEVMRSSEDRNRYSIL